MFLDPLWLLLILFSTVIGAVTQGYIKSTFRKWSQVPLATGRSGAQVARAVLDANGLQHVEIRPVGGVLSDHYDPRSKVLGLSQGVHDVPSVAAAGVAAHEAGHAIQDARHYVWGRARSALVPVVNFGSGISMWLIMIGIFIQASQLVWLGVIFFASAVLFQFVTLPVEFDASRRALAALSTSGVMSPEQVAGARQVLTAAAFTYIAAALIAALQLLYFVGLARRD